MNICGIIPARWGSTRFPGKPLANLAGRPLIQWTYEKATQARQLSNVWVATDDRRIFDVVKSFGGKVMMTRQDHPSGTDRIAEATERTDAEALVNIQGDEPMIAPSLIDRVAECLKQGEWDMATAAVPIADPEEIKNPAVVKVVMGENQRALYFSRAVIPHCRDISIAEATGHHLYYRHLGIYGYTTSFLKKIVQTPPTPVEEAEKLEQLRALHLGAHMRVIITKASGPGIDTPEDLLRTEKALE